MKITVLKENLKEAFQITERAIGGGNILPILKNVLITTEKGRIKMAATDLEIGITSWINGKIVDEGGITVPANILGSILNNIDAAKMELEVVDSKLIIRTEKSENTIQGIKDDDFPMIPRVKTENYIEIKSADLKKGLEQVVSAASIMERRPEISGVLFWLKDKQLKLVATDTFRLAEKTLKKDSFYTDVIEMKNLIPLKTIQEVIKISEKDKRIKVLIDPNQVLFDFGDVEVVSRLVESNFPDYESIIPKEIETSVVVGCQDLINAVKLAAVFVGKVNDIKLAVNESKVEIFARESTIGENKSELEADVKGGHQELILNWHYLSDGLRGVDSENVILGLSGEIKPVVIKSTKEDGYFYILMPIKNN